MSGGGGQYKSARDLLAHIPPTPKSHRTEQRRATAHATKGRAAGHTSRQHAKQQAAAGGQKDASTGMSRADYALSALADSVLDDLEAQGHFGPPAQAKTHAPPSQQGAGGVFKALKQKLPGKQPTVTGRGYGKAKGFSAFLP